MLKSYISVNVPGIDDTPLSTEGSELIQNLRYDNQGDCWVNDRYLISYKNPDIDPDQGNNAVPEADVWSINSWKHNLLYEYVDTATGTLTLAVRIGNQSADLETSRPIPTAADLGTQYIQFSSYMVLINGVDYPLIYQGDRRARRAANTRIPNPPIASVPSLAISNYGEEAVGAFIRGTQQSSNAKLLQFPAGSGYGVGLGARQYTHYDQTNQQQVVYNEPIINTYEYAVSFITDTGSESAISTRSSRISWTGGGVGQTDTDTDPHTKLVTATYGVSLRNIPTGPPGTVRRILYRTKNMGDERGGFGEELYFCTYIDDNITQTWLDAIPDTGLGSLAPLSFERIPFPKCSIGAAFQNRLVVAGDPSAVYSIYYSDPGLPEQFSSSGIVNVSSARGGRITGLVPFNNLLIIFRETAIDALLNTGTGLQVVPVNASIGSLSPNTAVSIAGLGLMFLGADRKFYLLTGNYSGGSSIQITEASKTIGKLLRRINPSSLARAFAIYNEHDREYWCHVASSSSPICDYGLVYHLDTQGWSIRSFDPALSSATLLPERYVAFGTLYQTQQELIGGAADPLGIQVWGGLGNWEDPSRYRFIYESKWLHFGAPDALKRIKDIKIFAYKNAYVETNQRSLPYEANIEVQCAVDGREYFRSMGQIPLTNQEQSRTGILNLITTDAGPLRDYATWDQNYYDNGDQTITVRVNDNSSTNVGFPEELDAFGRMMNATEIMSNPTGGCRWYKVRIINYGFDHEVRLLGLAITYEIDNSIQTYTIRTGVGINNGGN